RPGFFPARAITIAGRRRIGYDRSSPIKLGVPAGRPAGGRAPTREAPMRRSRNWWPAVVAAGVVGMAAFLAERTRPGPEAAAGPDAVTVSDLVEALAESAEGHRL